MRSAIISFLSSAVLMILSTSGWSADNFEFSIQGESGLEFVITGYATDGAQIFRRETSQLEKNSIGMPRVRSG